MTKYTLKRNCLICGKLFLIDHPRRVLCSPKCFKEQYRIWDKARSKEKNLYFKSKGWAKKKELLLKLGGECATCGITDLRVLEFSHLDSKKKNPLLKSRVKMWTFTKWKIMESEAKLKRIILECANCHRIRTHTEMWENKSIN